MGCEREAQIFPKPVIATKPDSVTHRLLWQSEFSIRRPLHSPKKEFQPRVGFRLGHFQEGGILCCGPAWNLLTDDRTCCLKGTSHGTTGRAAVRIVWRPRSLACFGRLHQPPRGQYVPSPRAADSFGASVRVFSRNYANGGSITFNTGLRAELGRDSRLISTNLMRRAYS